MKIFSEEWFRCMIFENKKEPNTIQLNFTNIGSKTLHQRFLEATKSFPLDVFAIVNHGRILSTFDFIMFH